MVQGHRSLQKRTHSYSKRTHSCSKRTHSLHRHGARARIAAKAGHARQPSLALLSPPRATRMRAQAGGRYTHTHTHNTHTHTYIHTYTHTHTHTHIHTHTYTQAHKWKYTPPSCAYNASSCIVNLSLLEIYLYSQTSSSSCASGTQTHILTSFLYGVFT